MNLKNQLHAAVCAALLAVFSQIVIPIGPVPISLQTLMIAIITIILPRTVSLLSISLYSLLGIIGLPIFAGATSGITILFGPTGGYLIGFFIATYVTGYLLNIKSHPFLLTALITISGLIIILLCGTLWLKLQTNMSFSQAFMTGFIPFIPIEIGKGFLAAWLGLLIKKRINV